MKTIEILIITLFIKTNCFSQATTRTNDSLNQILKGTWYVVNYWPKTKDTLVFKRESNAPNNWGDRIEISENGVIIDAYSAPCGNDIRIHNTSGTWVLDYNSLILTTTIPIYLIRTKNKILKLNTDSLILSKIN